MGRGFFDRHGQPAWRRNEAARADRQRQAHDAARRERLGLAPAEPVRVSGMVTPSTDYDPTSAVEMRFLGTRDNAVTREQIAAYTYQWASNSANTLTDDELALRRVAPGDTREYEEIDKSRHAKAEREPSLREIWRD